MSQLLIAPPRRYDMGLIGGALVDIRCAGRLQSPRLRSLTERCRACDDRRWHRREFHTSEGQDELVVGATKVGAVFGTFLGGALMVHYGRRVAIALDSIFFMMGPLVMAASHSIA